MAQTVCINPPTKSQTSEIVDKVAAEISRRPVSGSAARSIAGGFVGNVIDKQTDMYDEHGVPLFTMVGLLAGTRMGVRATGVAGSAIKTGVDAVVPRRIKELMEIDKLKKNQDMMDAYGYSGNPLDEVEVAGFRGAINGVRTSLAEGRSGVAGFFNSTWVKSQFSTLRELGKASPVANKMISFLSSVPDKIKQMRGDLVVRYNTKYGTGAFEAFTSTKGVEIARPIMDRILAASNIDPTTMDQRRFVQELEESITRLLDTGFGGPNATERNAVTEAYAVKPWAKTFDEQIMARPEIAEYVNTYRDWFSRINRQHLEESTRLLNIATDELKVIVGNREFEGSAFGTIYTKHIPKIVDDFVASNMTWKQYVDSVDGETRNSVAALNEAMTSEREQMRVKVLFNRIRELRTQINGQERLHHAYVPHLEDKQKMASIKRRLLERGEIRPDGVGGDESVRGLPTFDDWVERKYYQTNYGNDRKLYAEDGELTDYSVKAFSGIKQAETRFNTQLSNMASTGKITAEQYREATTRLKEFVKKGRRSNADGTMRDYYYLEAPQGLSFNPFEEANDKAFKVFSAQHRANKFDVKKSSRIDYQRKLDMPYEFRQTNLERVATGYANDVAPRLHSYKNNIYDVTDFHKHWITPLQRDLANSPIVHDAEKIANRVAGIYNTSMRVNNFNSPDDMQSFEKMARVSNVWRNLMATAYQYGIGFYNLFEHAVQTPTLTSWDAYGNTMRLFGTNRAAANAMADTILDFKVLDMQLKGQGGNYVTFDDIGTTTWAERTLEQTANFSANFSVSKYLGRGLGIDVERGGLLRIAFDGFMGGNAMSTAINGHASLYELRKLTEAYNVLRNIPEGQPKIARVNGRRYNIGDVERKLANLGIDETNINGYMEPRTQSFLKDFMENIEAGRRLTPDEIEDNANSLQYILTVLNTSTENYQATNQFFRPEKAMTPGGRLAYQYSTYSYNQILQNVQRRIRFPIDNWRNSIPETAQNESMAKILYYYNTGDFDALRGMGLTNKHIQDFPADAYNQAFKFFAGAVGMSIAGHATVDTFRDVVANPFKDREDQWARLRRRTIVNPLAPKSEQMTFTELESFGEWMTQFPMYLAGVTIDTGLMGRFDAFYSTYGRQSLLDLTPVTRAANDLYRDMNKVVSGGVPELSNTLSDVALRNSLRYFPVVGASPFSEVRGVVRSRLLEDPKTRRPTLDGGPITPQNILPR